MVTTIRLPDGLHEELKRQAERKGMRFNAHVLSLLWDMQEGQPKKDETGENEGSDSI
ncbi:MAG: hypothetical protein HFJ04_09475 [Lachnospiraceae bacterium]|nr:hypothetical protein [Lachnospiraceae bacterium]